MKSHKHRSLNKLAAVEDLQLIQAFDLATVVNCAAVTKGHSLFPTNFGGGLSNLIKTQSNAWPSAEPAIMGLQNVLQRSIEQGQFSVPFDRFEANLCPIQPRSNIVELNSMFPPNSSRFYGGGPTVNYAPIKPANVPKDSLGTHLSFTCSKAYCDNIVHQQQMSLDLVDLNSAILKDCIYPEH
ncbi:hypothetical protein VNO77_31175 [Canavalia gladiata]|uniref:Uncharacterized protein n=1 Tax=Canavalia gladiata TaxID=3824 RepID=A0AAN9KQ47_CANGL